MVIADRLAVPHTPVPRATPPEGMTALDDHGAPPRVVVTVPPIPPLPQLRAAPRPPTLPPPPAADLTRPRGKPRSRTVTDRLALSLVEQARMARKAAESALRAPARPPLTPTDFGGPDTSPVPQLQDEVAPSLGIHGADTAPLRGPARPGSDPGAHEPYAVIVDSPPHLDVRFLRGSDWVPVRVRALSARGAYIVTGAPARLGDTVHVSVTCAGRTALVRGTVYHVTSADDAVSTGASGFAVRFPEYACPARTHLVQVLVAARNAGITLRPPPSRNAVRFPVRWPVQISSGAVSFRAEAFDVSAGGMFVATPRALDIGIELRFALPLDQGTQVEGSARVTRVLGPGEATSRGMRQGAGVRIVQMTDDDRAGWDAFLSRVRRRTEKRVLVGAAPGRVEELAAGLNAAGYSVTAGSDLGLIMRVAELDPCPPDIAVIDAELQQGSAPNGWIEQVFAARQVQCITIRGDVRRARSMVDRVLHVDA
jgi:hypothetical protein